MHSYITVNLTCLKKISGIKDGQPQTVNVRYKAGSGIRRIFSTKIYCSELNFGTLQNFDSKNFDFNRQYFRYEIDIHFFCSSIFFKMLPFHEILRQNVCISLSNRKFILISIFSLKNKCIVWKKTTRVIIPFFSSRFIGLFF